MDAPTVYSGSIFYIDDDQDDLDFFSDAVSALGTNVQLFLFPDDMFKILRNPPPKPSLIFLDLNMPLKTGFEIIQEIKQSDQLKKLPLIVYSTASSADIVKRCWNSGASLFITKPTSLEALKNAIDYALQIDWDNHRPTVQQFLYKA